MVIARQGRFELATQSFAKTNKELAIYVYEREFGADIRKCMGDLNEDGKICYDVRFLGFLKSICDLEYVKNLMTIGQMIINTDTIEFEEE